MHRIAGRWSRHTTLLLHHSSLLFSIISEERKKPPSLVQSLGCHHVHVHWLHKLVVAYQPFWRHFIESNRARGRRLFITIWHQKNLCRPRPMLNIALDIDNCSARPSWKWSFSNGQNKENFSMLKLELKPTVWHQKHLSMLNIDLDTYNFSSWQPSWTPFGKWPFPMVRLKESFSTLKSIKIVT